MLHPTISRKHAILQYKENGEVFIYDLGSTNGVLLNFKRIKPFSYVKIEIGDGIKFGQS